MDNVHSDLPVGWNLALQCPDFWEAPPVWMFEDGKCSGRGLLLQMFWVLKRETK